MSQNHFEGRTNSNDAQTLSYYIGDCEDDAISSSSSSDIVDVKSKTSSSVRSLTMDEHRSWATDRSSSLNSSTDFSTGSQVTKIFYYDPCGIRRVKRFFVPWSWITGSIKLRCSCMYFSQVNVNFEMEQLRMELRQVHGMYAKAQSEAIDASRKLIWSVLTITCSSRFWCFRPNVTPLETIYVYIFCCTKITNPNR